MAIFEFENLTFIQFIENCEYLKGQYCDVLSPFFNKKMVRLWKIMIYSLDLAEWKRDKIWEYLNDDITKEELEMFR